MAERGVHLCCRLRVWIRPWEPGFGTAVEVEVEIEVACMAIVMDIDTVVDPWDLQRRLWISWGGQGKQGSCRRRGYCRSPFGDGTLYSYRPLAVS
jgi:hypothetical protein